MNIDYESKNVPIYYCCSKCNMVGVKLWRDISFFFSSGNLLCCKCACEKVGKDISEVDERGLSECHVFKTPDIGNMVPAILTEDGLDCWSITCVPKKAFKWWHRLPNEV